MIIICAYVPMQLFFAFSYHPLQQQVRFSGQRPGRKLPLAGDYPWGVGWEGGGTWRIQLVLSHRALEDTEGLGGT